MTLCRFKPFVASLGLYTDIIWSGLLWTLTGQGSVPVIDTVLVISKMSVLNDPSEQVDRSPWECPNGRRQIVL